MRDQIDFLYAAGEPRRFHTWAILRERTIAHHSWHVAMLLHILYGQSEPGISSVLLLAALTHDMAEWQFGDIPSPAKRALSEHFPDFRAKFGEVEQKLLSEYGFDFEKFLNEEELRKLKFCDNLEGALYCCEERALGNRAIKEPYNNFRKYLNEVISDNQAERETLFYLDQVWEACNGSEQ